LTKKEGRWFWSLQKEFKQNLSQRQSYQLKVLKMRILPSQLAMAKMVPHGDHDDVDTPSPIVDGVKEKIEWPSRL